jgi:hypothetical protein
MVARIFRSPALAASLVPEPGARLQQLAALLLLAAGASARRRPLRGSH